jgi:hypothetical protein
VEAATRAVYEAVTGKSSEALPAGASLDSVLQILNTNLKEGGAQQLLNKVKQAIVDQGLSNVFDAALVDATSITGMSCQNVECANRLP